MLLHLLPAVVAAGIVIGGIVLWRALGKRRIRWVAAALAAYGAIAFTLAAAAGSGVTAALAGHGVLAGTVIGAFVVLPAAWLVAIVRVGIPRLRAASPWRAIYQAVAVTVALSLVAASIPGLGRSFGRSGAESLHLPPLAQPPSTPPDPLAVAERVAQTAPRIRDLDWNVDSRADALGADPAAAFAFVRDRIRYEAYSGALRGASGTFTERAGNAIDRALLLAHLLDRHGTPVRFAIGHLADGDRRRLWQRVFEPRTPPRRAESDAPNSGRLDERVFARADRDYRTLRRAVGDRLQPVTAPTLEQILAEMDPHVWVQAKVGDQWMDLDPSFKDAKPGSTTATFGKAVATLPDELFQHARFRVVVDSLTATGISHSTRLNVAHRTVDLVDRQIFLLHQKGVPGSPMNGLADAFTASMSGRPSVLWTPMLWIDGTVEQAEPIDLDPNPSTRSTFVRERLEIEVTWPNGRRDVIDRVLVDRAGAAFAAGQRVTPSMLRALDGDQSGPFAMQAVHNLWFSAGRHQLANYADAVDQFVDRQLTQISDPVAAASRPSETSWESLWPMALNGLSWMIWSDHVVVPRLNDTTGIRMYADGPRVAIFTSSPHSGGTRTFTSDLCRDDLRGVQAGGQEMALAEKKLWYGLTEGALEQEELAELAAQSGGDPASVESTSARLTDRGLVVLQPGDIPAALPPEAREGITVALHAGKTVATPLGGTEDGGAWWEIASGSGDTRAIAAERLHGAQVILPAVLPTARLLSQYGRVARPQGAGVARIDMTAIQRQNLTRLMESNRAARQAERIAQARASNAYKPIPARAAGNEDSMILATVALTAGGIILNAIALFSVIYEVYFIVGLFLEGPL